MATSSRMCYAGTANLAIIALCFGLGQNLIKPLIAPQAVAVGGDALTAGFVIAASGVGGFLVAVPLGVLVDRVGGRRIIATGAALLVAGAGLMAAATAPGTLAAGYFLFGAGGTATWLAAQALATMAVDDASARRKVAWVSTAVLAGNLGGPPLGGLLADTVSVRAAILTSLATGMALLPTALALPAHRRPGDRARGAWGRGAGGLRMDVRTHALLSRPGFMAALVASAIAMALQTSQQAFLPLYLRSQIGWSATEVGLIFSVAGVGALVARAAFTFLDRRLEISTLIALSLLPGALSLGAVVSTGSAVTITLAVLVSGFSLGLAQPVTLLFVARLTSQGERGHAVGLRMSGNRLAQVAAPVAFGGIAALLGLTAAFWAMAILCGAGGALLAMLSRQR